VAHSDNNVACGSFRQQRRMWLILDNRMTDFRQPF
jgi:hypothetical protein